MVIKEQKKFDGGTIETVSKFTKSKTSKDDIVALYNEGGCTQKEIEDKTGISQATVSRRIKKKQIIERTYLTHISELNKSRDAVKICLMNRNISNFTRKLH